jgi:SAM-dependent methyltransferase
VGRRADDRRRKLKSLRHDVAVRVAAEFKKGRNIGEVCFVSLGEGETMDSCLAQTSGAAGCQKGWRRQFARPSGVAGWLVGHLLAFKNRRRGEWVRSLLNVRPGDHVLEIGFGPGVDILRVSEAAEHGFVAGIDPSSAMVRQAKRRNSVAVEAGLVELLCAPAERIPYPAGSFDKVYAINSLQFCDLPRALQEIHRVLKAGGLVAAAIQPRSPGATERTVDQVDVALQAGLRAAGFASLKRERKLMKPVSCVCVQAVKPAESGSAYAGPEHAAASRPVASITGHAPPAGGFVKSF